MSKKMGSITVISILVLISAIVSILLFGLLTSTGVFKNNYFEFGGAAAGFVFTITFLSYWHSKMEITNHNRELDLLKLKNIVLTLNFDTESLKILPNIDKIQQTDCYYSIYDNDKIVINNKQVLVKSDPDTHIPYINIQIDSYENPEYAVKLTFNNVEWVSDTYSQKRRRVLLR